jgi:type I restriction enzyme S subunit
LQPLNELQTGTSYPAVRDNDVFSQFIPLPPLSEQRAIVSKIELLFSELDNGIANLKLAQEQLKVYRQAVLKKAFEGELTKKWRGQQTDLPDAGDLLEQVGKEREEAAKISGKKLKLIKPLNEAELVELSRLPSGWRWTKIGDVSNCIDSQRVPVNKSERITRTGNIPYYGANGQVGWIDDYLFDETLVLVVEDETFTGREKPFSYIITGKSWVNNHAHVLQATSGLDIDFLNYQLSYYPFTRLTTGTTGRKKLTQLALINAPFKICSLPEQQVIVQEIDTRLSVCDKIEQDIKENLEKAEALRQSILKKAFEGKLLNERELAEVRGAEDWEPAEVLLEKISYSKVTNRVSNDRGLR